MVGCRRVAVMSHRSRFAIATPHAIPIARATTAGAWSAIRIANALDNMARPEVVSITPAKETCLGTSPGARARISWSAPATQIMKRVAVLSLIALPGGRCRPAVTDRMQGRCEGVGDRGARRAGPPFPRRR